MRLYNRDRKHFPVQAALFVLAGLGAGAVAGYEYRGSSTTTSQNRGDMTLPEATRADGAAAAELCGAFALKEAGGKFLVVANIAGTNIDELTDSQNKAMAEGQPIVDQLFSDCMDRNFKKPAVQFSAEAPKFVPTYTPEAQAQIDAANAGGK